jgi:protein-S-isoprenylcysteine O-methyltransferase Ste14
MALSAKTVSLFAREGGGTLAPWDPPKKFVVGGPYLYVRNPMLTSVNFLILAEVIALNSYALLGWATFFFALNTAYFILVEEPGLERRFGEDYRKYKSNVPRWIPNTRPYKTENGRQGNAL